MGMGEDGAERDRFSAPCDEDGAGRSIEAVGVRALLSGILRHEKRNNLSTCAGVTKVFVCWQILEKLYFIN